MVEGDPTTGELRVQLQGIVDLLNGISRTMVTKDVFDTWRNGNNERIARVEQDLSKWINSSTTSHVELDRDSKARHQETMSSISSLEADYRRELKDITARQDQNEKDIRSARNARANMWIAAGLAVLGSIVTGLVLYGLLGTGH